jgi:hypothetical protein
VGLSILGRMRASDLDPPPHQPDPPPHEPHRGNRHRRSEQARLAVLAADDLLAERGFADLTIEGIATRAGVAMPAVFSVKADSFVSCTYGR